MSNYQIIAYRTLTEDSYDEGQQSSFQELEPIEATIEADSTREAVKSFYLTELLQLPYFDCVEGHKMYTSHLVDEELLEPTEEELQTWKQGKMKLYALDIEVASYRHIEEEI